MGTYRQIMLSPQVFRIWSVVIKRTKNKGGYGVGEQIRGAWTRSASRSLSPAVHNTHNTSTSEKADLLPVILTPNAKGRLNYRVFAIWGGGIDGIETETAFAEHLQRTTTALNTPPRIKFLPKEEEK